jgi:F0F1-type ATP synthase membrane subunit b/b'
MDIMALIDRIEEMVDSGRNVPFSANKLVDPDKIYEIVDEIRANFPDELKQARWIVKERQEMLEEAEKEANRILEESRDRAQAIASEQEIVKLAEQQAADILDNARARER